MIVYASLCLMYAFPGLTRWKTLVSRVGQCQTTETRTCEGSLGDAAFLFFFLSSFFNFLDGIRALRTSTGQESWREKTRGRNTWGRQISLARVERRHFSSTRGGRAGSRVTDVLRDS